MVKDDIKKIINRKSTGKNEGDYIESLFYDESKLRSMPLKITIAYFLSGGLWILFSDRILSFFIQSKSLMVNMQAIKGWLYVFITSLLIYVLIGKYANKNKILYNKLKNDYQEIQTIHEQLIIAEERLRAQYDEFNKFRYYDMLTDTPNRELFINTLENEIIKAVGKKIKHALLFVDLDNFKETNDTLGHNYGDELLKKVAILFKASIKEGDIVSRVGGDEFFILMKNIVEYSQISYLCEKLQNLLNSEINIMDKHIYISASIGITVFPDDGDETGILLKNADTSMYSAKYSGRAKYSFFDKSMSDVVVRRVEIEKGLRCALKNNELEIYYQPQIDIINNKIKGFEALLRWNSSELGWISPAEFIPVAEQSGLLIPMGDWIIKTVCNQNKLWKSKGYIYDTIAINLSSIQLENNKFEKTLKSLIAETKINPKFVELEITESILMKDFENNVKLLTEIRKLGINIALDDFGTGYSSLSYLKLLPINTLKIDKSFIDNIVTNDREKSIVDGIIQLAQKIGLDVIAEGAESKEQIKLLQGMGCNQIQGYYFSKPLPACEIEEMFLKSNFIEPYN